MSQHTKTPMLIVITLFFSAIVLKPDAHSILSSHPAPAQPSGVTGDWKLIFKDEFDEESLNPANWVTCYWWDWQDEGCTISSNNELQWYQSDNVSVQNGILTLEAREQSIENSDGELFEYTSGVVTTGKLDAFPEQPYGFNFQYGFTEIRARIPDGQGLWSAFWLLPSDHISRPEIDIMEILGHDPYTHEMHFHFINELGERMSFGETALSTTSLADDWHTYGLDWQPNSLTWYLDGELVWHYESPVFIPNEPMYLLLNLAVGGDWPGSPDDSTHFPAQFEIDYVQVWRRHHQDAVLPLVQDAYIDGENQIQNYGEAAILSTDGNPQKLTLLQFDATPIQTTAVGSAVLSIHTAPEMGDGSENTAVIYHVPNLDWLENELTFANSDIQFGNSIGTIMAPEPNTRYDVLLDTAVFNQYQEGKITFAIINTQDDGLHIISKENNENAPRLTVTPLDFAQYLPMVTLP